VGSLIAPGTDAIFHLAAIVSGQAEADTDLGYRVNLDGTRAVLEACRALGTCPRLVFASSLAVYGGRLPPEVGDDTALTPQTSYGTQKAIGELLVNDYSRKGFVDGRALRLPTVVVRPGRPNRAASTFASSMIREPLAGQEAILPVPDTVRHWHASPRAAIGFLLHAASLDTAELGARRNLSMPGLSATVGEQIAALERVAGKNVVSRIKRVPDPAIISIVDGWPRNFQTDRAARLGFTTAEKSFDDIIRIHIEDELGGKFVG
jgi:nucleoside-diphosphate-sugar epimerase